MFEKPKLFCSQQFFDNRGSLKDFKLDENINNDRDIKHAFHSFSKTGVIRGMHFQGKSAPQDKVVICLKGSVTDVLVDIRMGSPTFGSLQRYYLGPCHDFDSLYIPHGFAHGFQALKDTDLLYLCTEKFALSDYHVINPLDEKFAQFWDLSLNVSMSEKDAAALMFKESNLGEIM